MSFIVFLSLTEYAAISNSYGSRGGGRDGKTSSATHQHGSIEDQQAGHARRWRRSIFAGQPVRH